MLRICLLLISALLLGQISFAQGFEWAQQFSSTSGNTGGYKVVADSAGNAYVLGSFTGNATISSFTLASPTHSNFFLAKYDPNGNVLWATQGTGSSQPGALFLGPGGQVYVSGSIGNPGAANPGNSVTIGSTTLTSQTTNPYQNFFLARFDGSGNVAWAKQGWGEGSPAAAIRGITADAAGNVYLTGSFGGNLRYHTAAILLPSAGLDDAFVLKLNPAGDVVWARRAGGAEADLATNIALTPSGDLYLAGYYRGPATFGPFTLLSPSFQSSMVLARLDMAGNFLWAHKTYGSEEGAAALAADQNGNLVVSGTFNNWFGPDSTTLLNGDFRDGFIAKYGPQGNLLWARTQNGVMDNQPFDLTLDPAGNTLVTGTFTEAISFGSTTLYSSSEVDTDIYVVKYNPSGALISAERLGGLSYEVAMGITWGQHNGYYLTGTYGGTTTLGQLTLQDVGNNFFLAKSEPKNSVAGMVFFDHNGDGILSAGDTVAPEVLVALQPGPQFLESSLAGRFFGLTNPGSYTLTLPNPPLYHTAAPVSYSGSFTSPGQTDTAKHFALQPIPNQQDLRVTLTQISQARPGFACRYQLTYQNVGTVTMSGLLQLQYDPQLQYTSASVTHTSHNSNVLTWSYANLKPQERKSITVSFIVPVSVSAGSVLSSQAAISPLAGDLEPADNSSNVSSEVVASYDPNDKQVSQTGITPAQVLQGKWLEYTIRFQNTGTASATFVMLRDTLSQLLQLGTLEVMAASHPYQLQLLSDRTLQVLFRNINLPDSATDEAGSHGFFRYRIRPQTGLQLGEQISNTAYLYFDFNAPVATNTAFTTVAIPLGQQEAAHALQVQLWPNPSTGMVQLQVQHTDATPLQVRVLNALGQTVHEQTFRSGSQTRQLDLSAQPRGLYLVQISQGSRSTMQKLVLK